ncbi:DUF397 domain-containing protein [Gandjariella thermophila]|uniref:DUF397 domain-containing protein n=1 Tax=Gandjariella thermophila TaxID=1931992 RepID=A0A4D4JBL8_9PSEU|nr:DUF397 domain-containing protein [Gandjariella thermophila]GDY34061.1 DUF397 domain-containing protein [Gandjariella thermophila]
MAAPKTSGSTWRKSSHSGTDTNCVEVAFTPARVAVRDSKNPTGPTLSFAPARWRTFLRTIDR